MKKYSYLLMVAFAAGVSSVSAQVYDLDPVVVTATRSPLNVMATPANVGVISAKQIENGHYKELSQVLRDEPAVYIANYAPAGYASNSLYINGSDKVVLMVDGIRVNQANYRPDLTVMRNLHNIERIEVAKGASSSLYGSDAVGGVINIITKQSYEDMKTGMDISAGSYHTERYRFFTHGGKDGWRWNVSYQKDLMGNFKDAQGLEIPQHLNAKSLSFTFGKKINEIHDISVSHEDIHSDEMYSDSNKKLDSRRKARVDRDTTRLIWKSKFNEILQNRFIYAYTDYDADYNGWKMQVKTREMSDQFTWTPNNKHTVVAGWDWTRHQVKSLKGMKLQQIAFYAQDQWKWNDDWTLTAGLRTDKYSLFGRASTPHVSLAYRFSKQTNAYISYNRFFVAPAPTQMTGFYGNPNLKPESGFVWEIGVNHQFSDTMVGHLSAFTRESKDKIGYSYVTKKYANFTNVEKAKGINLDVKKQITPELFARLGYTFIHVDKTVQRARNVDGYIPRHAVTIGMTYAKNRFTADLDIRGKIDRPGPRISDVLGSYFPKTTYWITDLSLNYQVNDNIKLYARINNLFNVFYAEHSNARGQWGGKPNEWWTAPGRNFILGASYTF